MASANTIAGKLYTPADPNTGERRQILVQSTTDNIFDGATGKTLKSMILDGDIGGNYSDATESSSGLMTPTQVTNLNNLINEKVIISSISNQPNEPCMWYAVEVEETN